MWKVAIKRSLGKLDAPDVFTMLLLDVGAVPLTASIDHARAVRSLPWHHRDPFDRLLIAQAALEDAVLVSKKVLRLWRQELSYAEHHTQRLR